MNAFFFTCMSECMQASLGVRTTFSVLGLVFFSSPLFAVVLL